MLLPGLPCLQSKIHERLDSVCCCPYLIRGGLVQSRSGKCAEKDFMSVACKMAHVLLPLDGLQMWSHACGAGSPVRLPCDFSTKAQECSGIIDRQLHPPASPSGFPAISLNTELPLSLRQPQGIMLLHPATGVLVPFANTLLEIRVQP